MRKWNSECLHVVLLLSLLLTTDRSTKSNGMLLFGNTQHTKSGNIMARKTLKEIAASDRQVARFLERAKADVAASEVAPAVAADENVIAAKLHYAPNHLSCARNISQAAQDAISSCVLG